MVNPSAGRDGDTPSLRAASRYLLRLFMLIRPYWGPLGRGTLLGLVAAGIGMILPMLTPLFIDRMYPARDVSMLQVLVLGVMTLMIASTVVSNLRGYYSQTIGGLLSNALALLFFNHVQHLGIRFFEEHRVGEVTSRLGDVKQSLGALTRTFETLLLNSVYLILVPPILLLINWRLAVLSLASVPLTSVLSVASGRYLRQYWKRGAEAQAELSAMQVDALSQIRTIKLAGAERASFQRVHDQSQLALSSQLHASGVSSIIAVLTGLVKALSTAACTWYGWTLILRQDMTLGGYLAFTAYLGYLTGPVTEVASLFADFQRSSVSLTRMFEYLDLLPESDPSHVYRPAVVEGDPVRGDYALTNVSYAYSPERVVLHNISLEIAAGSITAIAGPSGAGKSSLIRLLVGLDRPTTGRLQVDGRPLHEYAVQALRQQMAVVWQESGMLRGSVWDNLTIGLSNVSKDVVERAVEICRLTDTISALKGGYNAQIAEWGASLSAGQRQRVALARAVIRRTPILVLDEATANIDVHTESGILRDLFAFTSGQTILFVTHRVASAASADQVCLLSKGEMLAVGPHAQLLVSSDVYREMHQAATGSAENRHLRVMGARP